ncbi:MAG: GH92 family glycosyl hydrolase [Bacteroidales bacterium]|nr:GH92 family glycosyl hydrolase [Candidatus Physcousia equi]
MKKYLLALAAACCLSSVAQETEKSVLNDVDPMIGSADHGHVFVGAHVPFGMVNVGPTQLKTGWDWCSGYHYSCDEIVGFAHTHLSGTGCSDLGDIALMPSYGELELSREGLASTFDRKTEVVAPGYYGVQLDRGHISCQLTATRRVAMHRYHWPHGTRDARITIDLLNGIGDRLTEARMVQMDDQTVVGYRISHGWANEQHVYFCIQFSRPMEAFLTDSLDAPFGQALFQVGQEDHIEVKVALSPTSEVNAINNLAAEMPEWDFDEVRKKAAQEWERELGRVEADFRTEQERRIFYTSMYHFMMAPQTWNDVTGDYRGADYRVHRSAPFENLTTWSLWDTYRAAHPLATIILPDRLTNYAQTMLHIARQRGELPVWHLHGCETYCMVGCPALPVMADLILKGVKGFDYEEAYRAMKASMLKPNRGKHYLESLGYLPYDGLSDDGKEGIGETVAKNLEYFLAEWSLAQVAGRLGHKEDSVHFAAIAQNYRKLFDPRVRCMRALSKDGKFRSIEGFNPGHQTADYTEGNPWQYTWLVPHDVEGLIETLGGKQAFTARLDSLFTADGDLGKDANPDISGLIGQYAHGNEPSHHTLYLYNYVGQPEKTQQLVRRVMNELYSDQPAGLCGNEDVGQMSAWYILSALGFYQVEPCGGRYQIGSPIVERAVLHLPEGKTFTILTHGGDENKTLIKKMKLNGKPYTKTYLEHADIMAGGTWEVWF